MICVVCGCKIRLDENVIPPRAEPEGYAHGWESICIARLREANEKLREGLEVYADQENWMGDEWRGIADPMTVAQFVLAAADDH